MILVNTCRNFSQIQFMGLYCSHVYHFVSLFPWPLFIRSSKDSDFSFVSKIFLFRGYKLKDIEKENCELRHSQINLSRKMYQKKHKKRCPKLFCFPSPWVLVAKYLLAFLEIQFIKMLFSIKLILGKSGSLTANLSTLRSLSARLWTTY